MPGLYMKPGQKYFKVAFILFINICFLPKTAVKTAPASAAKAATATASKTSAAKAASKTPTTITHSYSPFSLQRLLYTIQLVIYTLKHFVYKKNLPTLLMVIRILLLFTCYP